MSKYNLMTMPFSQTAEITKTPSIPQKKKMPTVFTEEENEIWNLFRVHFCAKNKKSND